MRLPLHAQRTVWDLAIPVLGVNLWVCFLLLPLFHLERPGPTKATLVLAGLALLVLGAGILLRSAVTLIALFPLILVAPVVVSPQLVGVNVFTPWTFVLVLASFLAYLLTGLRALQSRTSAPDPAGGRDLGEFQATARWRRRFRIYRWLAALAVVFPGTIVFTLFLHPGVQADLRASYPGRAQEAVTFFGVLGLALWLVIFHSDFLVPLRAHVRGDPQVRADLERLRYLARQRRPRPAFYLLVALALAGMVVLLVTRG
jgi:lysylphosphatidylglycerol synthetase-like protein (DUF2156 family)